MPSGRFDSSEILRVISKHGNALFKFISPNDAGATGAHQSGFYMPFDAKDFYTSLEPRMGENGKEQIRIRWNDEIETSSVITWYGRRTRHEYRLTRFGREFPFLNQGSVGNLLILIKTGEKNFSAYVLENEMDIEEVLDGLGVNPLAGWARYPEPIPEAVTEGDCITTKIRSTVATISDFPRSSFFSDKTHAFFEECVGDRKIPLDDLLIDYYKTEERLFKALENKLFEPRLRGGFRDIDDFTEAALSLLNRRKSRSGRSLENHVDYILNRVGIAHDMRPNDIEGVPDVVIPSSRHYHDRDDGIVLAVKTTCKDRWRQILNEARKAKTKYLLTLQPFISEAQLNEMGDAGVVLVVPASLKSGYPTTGRARILDLASFCRLVKLMEFNA